MTKSVLLTPLRNIYEPGTQNEVMGDLTRHIQNDRTRKLLQSRYLYGTIRQLTKSQMQSVNELNKLRNATRDSSLGAFLIRSFNGDPIGLASVQPDLVLRRYRELPLIGALPLAPWIAHRTPLETVEPTEGSFVEAWTVPGYETELCNAYAELADPTGIAENSHIGKTSWTVEPKDAPYWVHAAIVGAGYNEIKAGHFEHDTTLTESAPLSVLYRQTAA